MVNINEQYPVDLILGELWVIKFSQDRQDACEAFIFYPAFQDFEHLGLNIDRKNLACRSHKSGHPSRMES